MRPTYAPDEACVQRPNRRDDTARRSLYLRRLMAGEKGVGGWIAGVAATVVGGLILAVATGKLNLDEPNHEPNAHVVAFTQFGNRSTAAPSASITVENVGTGTAEDCVVHWRPGMANYGLPVDVTSAAFALDAGRSQVFTLSSQYTYGQTGKYSGSAWVVCSSGTSPTKTATIFVLT
jgi:hypothetical protein